MNENDFLWAEKYRPRTVSECVLPESIKSTFQTYVDKKSIPNLFLIGSQGTGKTSIAKAVCNEVGCDYMFLNGSSENGIDTFRTKIQTYASSMSLTGGKKVIIIDEADGLTKNLFDALRSGIETFHMSCSFILTGNYRNKIPAPIFSKFTEIDFTVPKQEKKLVITEFFKKVCKILDKEGVKYDKEVVASLVNKYFPDNRKVLVELQRYAINGEIDAGILSQVGDIQLKDLIGFLKDKNYTKTREWVVSNLDNDSNTIYRKIYDGLYSFLTPSSVPQVVLIIAKYQYQTAFVNDPEIQLLAFLTEIMVEAEFK